MHVLKVRAPHLSFMFLKEYWFRELYLGLKVTASFDRSESYTRVCDLWDPGWGDPGFPQCALLLFSSLMAIFFPMLIGPFCLVSMAGVVHGTQDAIAPNFRANSFSMACFLVLVSFLFVCVVGFWSCFWFLVLLSVSCCYLAWKCSLDCVQVRTLRKADSLRNLLGSASGTSSLTH